MDEQTFSFRFGKTMKLENKKHFVGRYGSQGYKLLVSFIFKSVLIVLGFIFLYFIFWERSWLSIEGLK